jgi:MarR family transcriptional regulator for hemolysin
MPGNNYPLGFLFGNTLRMISRIVIKKLHERKIDLTIEQFVLLQILNLRGELIQQEISEIMGKDKSVILRQINVLEKRKLVARNTDNKDKRKNMIKMTKAGKLLFKKLFIIQKEVSQELILGIGKRDLDVFYKVVHAIRANASQD